MNDETIVEKMLINVENIEKDQAIRSEADKSAKADIVNNILKILEEELKNEN